MKETHTPARAVRVDERLWRAAQEAAARRGETISDVIRAALWRYVDGAPAEVDLRACCDHPAHEPGKCEYFTAPRTAFPGSIQRCDCDGSSPSARLG